MEAERPSRVRRAAQLVAAALVAGTIAAAVTGGMGASIRVQASLYSGGAFDTCTVPSNATLNAWLAGPYRGVGIYIGGVNRACANTNLTPTWLANTLASGWNVIPTYVGLQAPCTTVKKLATIAVDGTAGTQGTAAAVDAAARAAALGIPTGSPIYLDIEGYPLNNPSCSQVVEAFAAGWVTGLHARGYITGVYGSAASTIRDMVALAGVTTPPDAVWIANWNDVTSVYGDKYIADGYWATHQRLHQYAGDHKETWGGVTITIDSNVVDGPVLGATGIAPAPTVPLPTPPLATPTGAAAGTTPAPVTAPTTTTPTPTPSASTPGGSVTATDSESSVTWTAGTFQQPVLVTLSHATPEPVIAGFGTGGYSVQLTVTQNATSAPLSTFAAPVGLHFVKIPGASAPVYSTNGTTWKPVAQMAGTTLATGAKTGYLKEPDGSIDVRTTVAGWFALLPDPTPPTQPKLLSARFSHGELVLRWAKSSDNSGAVAGYQLLLDGKRTADIAATASSTTTRAFHPSALSVYRVAAVDASGNLSTPSTPVVVEPSPRPATVPAALPAWSWQLHRWIGEGRSGARPATAPTATPAWFWTWAAWRDAPFRLK